MMSLGYSGSFNLYRTPVIAVIPPGTELMFENHSGFKSPGFPQSYAFLCVSVLKVFAVYSISP